MIRRLLTCTAAVHLVLGCGHGEDEWRRAQSDIAKLKAAQGDVAKLKTDLEAADARHAADDQKYAAAQQEIDALTARVRGLEATAEPVRRSPAAPPSPSPPPRVSSGWRQIDRINIQGEPTCVVTTSVSLEEADAYRAAGLGTSVRTAFTKIEYDSKKTCPKEVISTLVSRKEFDCHDRTTRVLAGYEVDWSGKRTDWIGRRTNFSGDGTVTTVFPDDSIGDKEWKYVCGVTQAPH
jgi:hypothetical protein